MPRPKNDADKLRALREERRRLIDDDELQDAVSDDDGERISEITVPNINIHMAHPLPPAAPPVAPPAGSTRPARAAAGSHAELVFGVVERVRSPWQAAVAIALIVAVLVGLLATQGPKLWGGAHGAPERVAPPAGSK
jgi:hypothetical protein